MFASRNGNCPTQDQAPLLLEKANGDDLRSARDLAMLSVLVGCGLRRAEHSALTVEYLQIRQGHWDIVDRTQAVVAVVIYSWGTA